MTVVLPYKQNISLWWAPGDEPEIFWSSKVNIMPPGACTVCIAGLSLHMIFITLNHQSHVLVNNKEDIKAPHYWVFIGGIHLWIPPYKGLILRKMFTCCDIIIWLYKGPCCMQVSRNDSKCIYIHVYICKNIRYVFFSKAFQHLINQHAWQCYKDASVFCSYNLFEMIFSERKYNFLCLFFK